ncbi:MAG: tetratricopeptide repeat protein [Acidobacteriota bacterium]
MNTKVLVAAILGILAGLVAGFTIANSINRSEINSLRGQVEQSKKPASNTSSTGDGFTIGDDELKAKIAEADANPQNLAYQKNLGRALYRYATMKNDTALLDESLRILTRANSLDPKDYEVLVDFGNAQFDVGYFKKDAEALKKARDIYEQALEVKPNDADVRTDLAISYLLDNTPDTNKAIDEFHQALKANPKQERALAFLTQAYMQVGNWADAAKSLESLKAANPKNDRIDELSTQIANKQVPTVK